tara:strand:- start:506 stop:1042 length:537 start_codon:yes stop_codon:yes gene_type:complete
MKPHIKVIQRNGVDIFVTSSMAMKATKAEQAANRVAYMGLVGYGAGTYAAGAASYFMSPSHLEAQRDNLKNLAHQNEVIEASEGDKVCVICGKENPFPWQGFCKDLGCSGRMVKRARYSMTMKETKSGLGLKTGRDWVKVNKDGTHTDIMPYIGGRHAGDRYGIIHPDSLLRVSFEYE